MGHIRHVAYMIFKLSVCLLPMPGQVRAGSPHQGLHVRPQLLGPLSGLCNSGLRGCKVLSILPMEEEILDLVASSQSGGMATRSAPVCLVRQLLEFDSCVQVESMETARA